MASVKKSKILEKADKYVRQKKLRPAIDELLRYVQSAPDDMQIVNIINKIGDLFAQMGNKESAIEYFQKSVDHYIREGFFTKAIAILKKILRMDEENIRALEQLAELYSQEGMVQDAKRQYLEIAEKYRREGLTKRALESYRKIVDMDPANVASRMKLAELFNIEGMQQEAVEQLITLAKTLRDAGKLDDAEKILIKTKKLDIPDPVVDITLAKVLVVKGELGKAQKVLETASSKFTRNPMIMELLGNIKMEQGDFDGALKLLSQVFQIDNSRDKALRELITRFLDEKQYAKAWKAAQSLLDWLVRNEEYDKAISLLKDITAKAEHFAPAIQKLAVLYEKNGEKVFQISALEKLANAYKMDGNVTGAEKALKQLVQLDPMNYDYKSALKDLGSSFAVEEEISGLSETAGRKAPAPLDPQPLDMEETRQQVRGSVAEAEMYVEYGLKKKAYKLLNKLLQQNPFDIKANRIFSELCIERGEIAKASKCYLSMAESYLKKGKTEKAEKFLDKSDRLLPGSASYLRKILVTQQLDDSLESDEEMAFLKVSDLEEPAVLEPDQLESISESVEIDVQDMDDFSHVEDDHGSVSEDVLFGDSGDELAAEELLPSKEIEMELPDNTVDLSQKAPFDTLDIGDLGMEESALELEEVEEMNLANQDSVVLDPASIGDQPLPDFNDVGLNLEKLEEEKQVESTRVSGTTADLTDELQEVDFYLSQNMVEEARDIIKTLELDHAGHPDLEKAKREVETAATMNLGEKEEPDQSPPLEEMLQDEFIDLQAEFGEDLDMFSDNSELTDKQATEQVKSLDELFSEFKKGVEQQIDQEDYETHYNLGIAYKEMGLTNESIEEFAKASHDDRRFLDCCFMIASVYEEIGDIDQALEWLESGIGRAESDGRDVKPLLYEAGRILEAAGQGDRAKEYFQRVYDISPKFRDVAKKIK